MGSNQDGPTFSRRTFSRMYYVIAGVGLTLLLVTVVGVALCRRNMLVTKRRLALLHAPLSDQEELYTDVLLRHQMANEAEGEINPLYGVNENEVS